MMLSYGSGIVVLNTSELGQEMGNNKSRTEKYLTKMALRNVIKLMNRIFEIGANIGYDLLCIRAYQPLYIVSTICQSFSPITFLIIYIVCGFMKLSSHLSEEIQDMYF